MISQLAPYLGELPNRQRRPGQEKNPWLYLIGIHPDSALSDQALDILKRTPRILGSARHFDLLRRLDDARDSREIHVSRKIHSQQIYGQQIYGQQILWPTPITDAIPLLQSLRERRREGPVVILASGDPFFYGVGAMIAAHFSTDEWICLPQPSSFSLAAARLGWSLQECECISLHGRTFERLIPFLRRKARLLILSWDGDTPRKIATELTMRKMGSSQLSIMETMGGLHERVRIISAQDYAYADVDPLNLVAIEVIADDDARIAPLTPGLPDDFFLHDGQITKREIRAFTLSALAPQGDELLWDIGAGSGSIAIEWMLANRKNRAIAIEPHAGRAQNIARNAALLGTPDLRIVKARAWEGLKGLPQPDAIFIGGGATAPGVMEAVFAALPQRGRLVVNAVTLETQTLLARLYGEKGGELIALTIAEAAPLGDFSTLRPALPVWRWRWIKS